MGHARNHPADEVYVTGSFDSWTRRNSNKLVKRDFTHEKTIALPQASEKIIYKVSDRGLRITNATSRRNDATARHAISCPAKRPTHTHAHTHTSHHTTRNAAQPSPASH